MTSSTARISPTAFATGYMWFRLGLSHPALATPRGKRLDRAFSLAIQPNRFLGRTGTFDRLMLARHRGIDYFLEQAIEAGKVTQIIEIAAGFSGRGWRMKDRYGDKIHYIETDLPHMAKAKQDLLEAGNLLTDKHDVCILDALLDDGPDSLASITAQLDSSQGLAIITEGLMSYLDPNTAAGLWRRISSQLQPFPNGLYVSDGYIQSEVTGLTSTVIKTILQRFVKGRLHNHYTSAEDASNKLTAHGFKSATLHAARDIPATHALGNKPGGNRVRVL
ncbi:MAG: class I SAM-dependent methyltransferase, partial [Nevskiales bacterium]